MPDWTIVEALDPALRDAIVAPLIAYNEAKAGPGQHRTFAIPLNGADGTVEGGLYGRIAYRWLFVELLVVPDHRRGGGTGAALLRTAEDHARAQGCVGACLDTYSFQARPFYERLGYRLVGTIDDYPPGHARHFLAKRLAPA